METIYTARVRTRRFKLGTRVASDGSTIVCSKRLGTIRIKRRARFACTADSEVFTINDFTDVERVLDTVFATLDDDNEHFVVVILDNANQVIGYKVLSTGPEHAGNLDFKLLYRSVLLLGGQRLILAHNHPAGNATPSSHDIALTGWLVMSGRLIEIEVLDHIIWTRKEQLSMRETVPQLFADKASSAE